MSPERMPCRNTANLKISEAAQDALERECDAATRVAELTAQYQQSGKSAAHIQGHEIQPRMATLMAEFLKHDIASEPTPANKAAQELHSEIFNILLDSVYDEVCS